MFGHGLVMSLTTSPDLSAWSAPVTLSIGNGPTSYAQYNNAWYAVDTDGPAILSVRWKATPAEIRLLSILQTKP